MSHFCASETAPVWRRLGGGAVSSAYRIVGGGRAGVPATALKSPTVIDAGISAAGSVAAIGVAVGIGVAAGVIPATVAAAVIATAVAAVIGGIRTVIGAAGNRTADHGAGSDCAQAAIAEAAIAPATAAPAATPASSETTAPAPAHLQGVAPGEGFHRGDIGRQWGSL